MHAGGIIETNNFPMSLSVLHIEHSLLWLLERGARGFVVVFVLTETNCHWMVAGADLAIQAVIGC